MHSRILMIGTTTVEGEEHGGIGVATTAIGSALLCGTGLRGLPCTSTRLLVSALHCLRCLYVSRTKAHRRRSPGEGHLHSHPHVPLHLHLSFCALHLNVHDCSNFLHRRFSLPCGLRVCLTALSSRF
jgi:hypothetical protein